jgi:hypothetical protein
MELPKMPFHAKSDDFRDLYTAKQMQEYARQAVLMEREACAMLCDESIDSPSDHESGCASSIKKLILART